MENNLHNIEFTFNYTNKTFNMTLEDIIYESNNSNSNSNNNNHINNSNEVNIKKTLKTIIKEKCYKNDIVLTEANIVLYDFENDYIINTINDLIIHKTQTCSIMIIPVKCDNHLY